MGGAMCQRLLDLDYPLTIVANRTRTHVDAAIARGAVEVSTAKEVAAASDIVMLCMDTSVSVESRMRGDDGVMAGMRPGATVIDFGTSLPGSTRVLAEEVAAAGGAYLDGPLGRTPAHAVDGKLNIMCAGDKAAYEAVLPVLNDLGENVFHLGASGAGHTTKLINNFFGMTTAMAMSEAFAMGEASGVDRQVLYDVMASGPLKSMMMELVKGYAVDGDPNQLAFALKNANKDVGYYAAMADGLGKLSIMSTSTKQALGLAVAQGRGDNMVSEAVDMFAELYKD
jgi:2-hydroxy-3-oxopropionate reductase